MTEQEVARRAAPLLARMLARLDEEGPVAANPADEGTSAFSLEPVASAGFPVPGLSGQTADRRRPGHHHSP
jgi:hypothetical protein